ncbi:MAG: phospholipid scramblase-related protein [Nannocystaceae bacterium]
MIPVLPVLARSSSLVVAQRKEWGEILTGWQTRNRYEISDPNTGLALHAGELSSGVSGFLLRGFLAAKRPFTLEVRDHAGDLALSMYRPFTFFFSRAQVSDGTGTLIGAIRQRWAWFARKFTLEDAQGREIATLHGPFFRPWTFRVVVGAQEVGFIKKRWSGLGKEMFSTADNFTVELSPGVAPEIHALCLAATFLIDFVYFERSG